MAKILKILKISKIFKNYHLEPFHIVAHLCNTLFIILCFPPTIVPDISKYHQYSKHHFYPHRSLVYPLACTVRPRCERVLCDLFMLRHTAESKLTSPNIKNLIQFKILYSSLNLKFYFTTHLIADPSSHSYSYIYSTSNETVKLSKHFSLSVRNICCFTVLTQDSF